MAGKCDAALTLLEAAATAGDTPAWGAMGYLFEHGLCVRRDLEKARGYYREGSERGDCAMEMRLGNLALRGLGGPYHPEKARWHFKTAALCLAGFSAKEMTQLSRLALIRYGVPEELENEFAWVRGIDRGPPHRQYEMALQVFQGTTLPRNTDTAFQWMQKAALGGFRDALYVYATWLMDPEVGRYDPKSAMYPLNKAAEKGHVEAQRDLGHWYLRFWDSSTKVFWAYVWFSIANANGLDVSDHLSDLRAKLSPYDLRSARERVKAILAKARKP